MKIYIVESNVDELLIFRTRSIAERVFESLKTHIMLKYMNSRSDIETSNDSFYLYNECEDCCYEGQSYYVKLHEKEIK